MNEIMNISGVSCYEKDGTAYLSLEAVARGLGFTQTKNGVEYVRWETVDKYLSELGFPNKLGKGVPTSGHDSFIPENIFYRLAMKAKNEAAEKFQALVADEIIPSIRKHGAYMTPETIERMLGDPDAMIKVLTALKEERERCKALAPDAEYAQNCLLAENGIVTSSIAKDYGMSADSFNKLLKGLKIQYKRGGQWLLYAPYQAEGYMVSKTTPITHSDGRVELKVTSLWTAEGRKFLYDFLKERGILPLNERGRA